MMGRLSMRERGLLGIGVLSALAYFAALWNQIPVMQVLTKSLPVITMALWLRPWNTRDGRLIAIGLILSALGDLLLESSPQFFLAGLLAFLTAHLAYLAAFVGRTRALALGSAIPIAVFGGATFVTLAPYLGSLVGAVIAYILVICTMMWRAWAQVTDAHIARPVAWFAALGATSFAISDTLVAYNRFIAPVFGLKLLLMVLYWAGQWGIAASAARLRAT